jgi:hypothetical protein
MTDTRQEFFVMTLNAIELVDITLPGVSQAFAV